jgi:putative DNA primase/helicase
MVMQGSLKVHHAFTSPAGRSTRVHLEVKMQVKVEQSVELGGDRAESEPRSAPSENCFGSSSPWGDKPYLIVDTSDLPATAHELRDILARSGNLFDRDGPVQVVPSRDGGPPIARRMTPSRIVREAHRLSRPVKLVGEELVPVALQSAVARMYLEMDGEWDLRPFAGICTAPVLSSDGSIRTAEGYDPESCLWCAGIPDLQLPDRPTRDEAEAALRLLRDTFRTFPFADAAQRDDQELGVKVVDLDHPPGMDESAYLVALLTAIHRPTLRLAPGLLLRGPEISGAGTGKGLAVRAKSAIAFGSLPSAFTKGGDRQELDKRLASDLIKAAPFLFLDNVNGTMLRSDLLASVLTERPARVRPLGRTEMVALNSTAFIAVTGNGVTVAEDLARRFLVCEFDARCEDPEQRRFGSGFLGNIQKNRGELLGAALTIWRYGRQHAAELERGRPLGSFEEWAEWCRDPLLTLGSCDPVQRIERIKADDPQRRQIIELFETWQAHHGEKATTAANLAEPVRALLDPHGRGRQFVAWRLSQLEGTRAGGFGLTRQAAAGEWGASTYALRRS